MARGGRTISGALHLRTGRCICLSMHRKNTRRTGEVATTALTEQEIRPAELMDQQRIVALIDLGRMLSRYSEFISVPCPACGCDNGRFKFEKNGIKYEECPECETFFVNPR